MAVSPPSSPPRAGRPGRSPRPSQLRARDPEPACGIGQGGGRRPRQRGPLAGDHDLGTTNGPWQVDERGHLGRPRSEDPAPAHERGARPPGGPRARQLRVDGQEGGEMGERVVDVGDVLRRREPLLRAEHRRRAAGADERIRDIACPEGGEHAGAAVGGGAGADAEDQARDAVIERRGDRLAEAGRVGIPGAQTFEELDARGRGDVDDTGAARGVGRARQEQPRRLDGSARRTVDRDRHPLCIRYGRRERRDRPLPAVGHRTEHDVRGRLDLPPAVGERRSGLRRGDRALEAVRSDDDAGHARSPGVLARTTTSRGSVMFARTQEQRRYSQGS
ncbi:unnamed protein product [Penicillium discolor]